MPLLSRAMILEALEALARSGREIKARYAFEDLWESVHGS
jgi:hypothetical protein